MKKVIPFSKTIHFKTMIAEVTDIEVTHTLEATDNASFEGDILIDGSYKMTEASQLEEKFHYTLPFTIEVDDKYEIQDATITIRDFYFEIINEEDLKMNVELEINNVTEKEEVLEPVRSEEEKIEEIEDIEEEKEKTQEDQEEPKEEKEETVVETKEERQDNTVESQEEFEVTVEPTSPLLPKKEPVISQEIEKKQVVEKREPSQEEILENSTSQVETKKEENQVSSIFSSINQEETFVTYYVYIVREQDTVDSIIEKYKTTREELSLYNDLNQVGIGTKLIIPCQHE